MSAHSLPGGTLIKRWFRTVTQTFPETSTVIYETISADVNMMALIGTYSFKAGQTTPALSIVTPGTNLPSLRSAEGVEVVVHDIADITRKDMYGSSILRKEWKVFVMCWEPSTGAEVTELVELMMQKFSGATSMETVAVADGIGAAVQTKVIIPSDMPIVG